MATLAVAPAATRKTPVHLWVVGILTLLWNAIGALDYLMTVTQNEAYMSNFTEEQLAYFYGFPAWAVSFWALAVWSSLLGSVALLLRSRWAVACFALALIGMVGTSLYTLVLSDGASIMGGVGQWVFTVVIWLVAIGLYFYARAQQRQGVLR